jgi:adenylate kinase
MRKMAVIGWPGIDLRSPAALLADEAELDFVDARSLFHEYGKQGFVSRGNVIGRVIPSKEFYPNEVTIDAIADILDNAEGGWVLCSYPRNLGQAELLTQRGHEPDTVIELVLTEDEIDLDPPLAKRGPKNPLPLSNYREQVEPLRAYYQARGVFQTISGFGDYEDVAARLMPIVSDGYLPGQ